MKKLFVLAIFLTASLLAQAAEWMTNYDQALATAKAQNKPVLANFSGSDWCGWCIRLDREVFSKPEFENWAEQNVVLLSVDFPRNKPQAADLKAQNSKLADKFHVEGFPTVFLLNSDGTVIAKTGYRAGGPTQYINYLQGLIKK